MPLVLRTVFASAAPADTRRGAGPQNARFDGRSIDLSKGCGNAQSCVVLTPEVRCFTTHAEADAFLGYDRASDQAARTAQATSCPSGWLCLYDGLNGAGRRLQFRDEYWNNLWEYDFARKASSVWNNQGCSDGGALDEVPPGNTVEILSCAYYSNLLNWDNRATGVHG
ncbi:peptidase inhibitor family I36 protein [Actinophytocola sp.]|uniref:peptidase inhibitor family I36 protein n=1 Tax=Actinophytocola sp. TaxID=1872138 RepID=UPI002ED47A4D